MTFSLDFFDALRRMKARSPDSPTPPPQPERPVAADTDPSRKAIGPQGLALIKHFESCARRRRDGAFEAYPDPGTEAIRGPLAGAPPAGGSPAAQSGRRPNAICGLNVI